MFQIFRALANNLELLNFALNFYIYCLCRFFLRQMLIFNVSTILCGCQTVTRDLALQRWNPPSLCFPVQAVLHCVQGQAGLEWVSLNNLVNLELEDGGVKLFSPRDTWQWAVHDSVFIKSMHCNVATLSVKAWIIVNLCHSVHYEIVPIAMVRSLKWIFWSF